ncbi:MAG: tRNA pseudouridine(13) synthase TruD [Phycisphaerales bacterium]|nr:tRNA pseudouridine(13) synthase TruD [Planctomycetota bacterium]MBL6996861.1 tRNA pseudouridine(13) synthase TruD [Phycisphaerales bacterium]
MKSRRILIRSNHPKILVGNKQEEFIHGVLKSTAGDFIVNEIPLYEPCGEGEHLYLSVRKTKMSHEELIRNVAKEFGVSPRDVGSAGRKDLQAVTTQTLSIYLPGKQTIVPESIGSIDILSFSWHTNKLRLGHLKGNSFAIRLREIDLRLFETIEKRLDNLKKTGLPNAFGPQRFGNYGNNHTLGHAILLEDWDSLVLTLLQGNDRHNMFAEKGEYKKSLDAWPFGQPAERNVLQALTQGKTKQQACKTINKHMRTLWVNSFQSAVFNEVLRQRQQNKTWDSIIEGDLVWNHDGGGRTFEVSQEESDSNEIKIRTTSFGVSPSGPLWGSKMRLPSGKVLQMEQSTLASFGVDEEHLTKMKKYAKGARRPLRVQVGNPVASIGTDSNGDFVEVVFELPAGSYATVLVEKLLSGEA